MRWVVFFGALLVHIVSYSFQPRRLEPFQYFSYPFFWWSYILLVDSFLSFRVARFHILGPNLPCLIVLSSSFWCIFELLNLRLENWFYVNVPEGFWVNVPAYFLSYGTVVPGIFITKQMLSPLFRQMTFAPVKARPRLSFALGTLLFLLIILFPLYSFPLTWIFLLLITDAYCYLKGFSSFMGEIEEGKVGNCLATAIAGLICGFLWEAWNTLSVAKWIYTVPFFEKWKLFEMPLPGYLGFVPFAFEVISFVNMLDGMRLLEKCRLPIAITAIVLCILSFFLIQKYTVFSTIVKVEKLTFIDENTLRRLVRDGVRTSYAIEETLLSERERERLRLLHLKGLGLERFKRLEEHGIDSVEKLSMAEAELLQQIWEERNPRRVRVFIMEAKKERARWQRKNGS